MTTPNLALPELVAAQSQPHVPLNTALRRLDAVVQLSIIEVLNDPPASSPSPPDGDSYIIGTAPTGEWAGRSGDIAFWAGNAWGYATPQLGWIAYNIDTGGHLTFIGGSPATWVTFNPGGGGGGGSAAEARLFEDFLNGPSTTPYAGWDASSSNIVFVQPASTDDAVGMWTLPTGTGVSGSVFIYYSNATNTESVNPACGPLRIRARIKAITPADESTSPSILRVGLVNTLVPSPDRLIAVEAVGDGLGSIYFRGRSRSANAELDETALGGPEVAADGWYTVEVTDDGANTGEAFVNGVSLGTFTTSSSNGYQLCVMHFKLGSGAANRRWDIDYFEFTQAPDRT